MGKLDKIDYTTPALIMLDHGQISFAAGATTTITTVTYDDGTEGERDENPQNSN